MNYKNDPRQITARFGRCKKCNKNVRGQEVIYFPAEKAVYCLECGHTDYDFFLSSKQDEEYYNNQYKFKCALD